MKRIVGTGLCLLLALAVLRPGPSGVHGDLPRQTGVSAARPGDWPTAPTPREAGPGGQAPAAAQAGAAGLVIAPAPTATAAKAADRVRAARAYYDADLIFEPIALSGTDLDSLEPGSELMLRLPSGGPLRLRLVARHVGGTHEVFEFGGADHMATLTRSDGRFYAWATTSSGSYLIENQGFGSLIASERELARRVLPGLRDGLRPPDNG